jgi:hypothetical protein
MPFSQRALLAMLANPRRILLSLALRALSFALNQEAGRDLPQLHARAFFGTRAQDHPPTQGCGGFCPLVLCFVRWFMCLSVGVRIFAVGGFRLTKTPKVAQRHVFQVELRALGAFNYLQRH